MGASEVVLVVVKNLPANEGDVGSIPGLRRSPGGGMATHPNTLAWEIPWTEEPYCTRGCKGSDKTEQTRAHGTSCMRSWYKKGQSLHKN